MAKRLRAAYHLTTRGWIFVVVVGMLLGGLISFGLMLALRLIN